MTKKRAKEILVTVIIRMRKPYYQGVAAELAFFFLLSMVPLFTILGEFMGVFSISMDLIDELITQYVSEEVADTLGEYLKYTPS
jgi:membrane protein